MINLAGPGRNSADTSDDQERLRLLRAIQARHLATQQGRPEGSAPQQSSLVEPRMDAQGYQLAQQEQQVPPQSPMLAAQQAGILGQLSSAPDPSGTTNNQRLAMLEAQKIINDHRASTEMPEKEKVATTGDEEKTAFEELNVDAKFGMQQVLQAIPLLRNMSDSQFQAAMPQLVDQLMDINPFLAKMIPQGGFTREDLDAIEQGMGKLNSETRLKNKGGKFKLQDLILPDGTKTIARVNESTGEVLIQSQSGDFEPAPLGSYFKADKPSGKSASPNKEGSPLASPTANKEQQSIIGLEKQLEDLNNISEKFDPEALTFSGKGRKTLAKFRDKLGVATDGDKEVLRKQVPFLGAVQRFLSAVIKNISGATVSAEEYNRLEKAYIGGKMSPTEFKANLDDLLQRAQEDIERHKMNLKEGITYQERAGMAGQNIKKIAEGQEVPLTSNSRKLSTIGMQLGAQHYNTIFPAMFKSAIADAEAEKGEKLTEEELDAIQEAIDEELSGSLGI